MAEEKNNIGTTQRQALEWLANGEVGTSSKTMAFWLAFGIKIDGASYPHDPADFDRCLQLLDRAPGLRREVGKMAEISHAWSSIVNFWEAIEKSHLDEVGLGWTKAERAPNTYSLMKRVLAVSEKRA